jgi:peptidoglycan/xylan/chitin deacetylase (PgdA/CDA1 family)
MFPGYPRRVPSLDRRRSVLVCVLLAILMPLTACAGSTPATKFHQVPGDGSPSATSSPSSPAPGSPSGTTSKDSSSTATAGSSNFAGLPKFGPPPVPQPINVPNGPLAPIYKRLPINQPVAFLTLDDGFFQLPPDIRIMQAAHIPFSMFLIAPVAQQNPGFFQQLEAAGGVVEDHTVSHAEMKGKPYEFQRREICNAKTYLQNEFGTDLHLFRPPFGDYDQTTLRAVHDCGLKAAFYWSETVNNGTVFYQTPEHKIHPGDIILMHFRPAFINDVIAALTAIHNAGLTPALPESYLN